MVRVWCSAKVNRHERTFIQILYIQGDIIYLYFMPLNILQRTYLFVFLFHSSFILKKDEQ